MTLSFTAADWAVVIDYIAAFLVARLLIPRFYALGVTTVYELLESRFSVGARRAAAAM